MMQALPGLGRVIQCRTPDGFVTQREAIVDWERGGLFVHHTPIVAGGFMLRHWTVSHAESGLALLQAIPGFDQAVRAAEALLAQDIDWTQSAGALRADPRTVQVREKVGDQLGGVW